MGFLDKLKNKAGPQQQYAPPPGPPPGHHAPPPRQPAQQNFAPPPGPPPGFAQQPPQHSGREDPFAALKRYDLVLIVDDSESMEMFWDQTRDGLVGVAQVACRYDDDGIDIHFFNSPHVERHVRTAQDLGRLFRRIEPRRSTPTATALSRVLTPYVDSLEQAKAAGQRPGPKPLNVVVLTDGAPNRGEEPDELLVSMAQRLDAGRFPPYQLGLQFIQIGEDDEAAQALQALDDDLKSKYKVRDFVDYTPYAASGGRLDSDFLLKALLGGINRKIDSNQ